MFDKKNLDSNWYKYCKFATIGQFLGTTYRELIGVVNSSTKYEQIKVGSDHFNNVLKDLKPIFSSFSKKRNLILYCTEQIQWTKFLKFRGNYTNGKKLFIAAMSSYSCFQKEQQLNQLKHKYLLHKFVLDHWPWIIKIESVRNIVNMELYCLHKMTIVIQF